MWEILAFIGSYFLGSIPFGYLVGKVKGYDLRNIGSGNIGATNVFRVVGKKEGIFVFALDFLKLTAFCTTDLAHKGVPREWMWV